MGFFDKLKASVGIGGAKVEITPDETLGFSGSTIGVKIVVKGGKLEQKLNCVNITLLDERPLTGAERAEATAKGAPAPNTKTESLWTEKIEGSFNKAILPGAELEFFAKVRIPDVDDPREHQFKVSASADIPGAVDPSADASFVILPRTAGALSPVGRLDLDGFGALLQKVGATSRDYLLEGDGQWRIWFTNDTNEVVALGDLKAVVSMRFGGKVARTWTNEGVSPCNIIEKLEPSEPGEQQGGETEAYDWAKRVVASAPVDALYPDAIGNTYFAIANFRAVRN